MTIHHLAQLPDEMRTKIQGILDELSTIQVALEVTEQRNRALRDELVDTLTAIGVAHGDTVEASEMGLRVKMVKQTRRRLDRSVLKRLGVPAQVLREATIQTEGDLHLRLERLK